MSGAASNTLTDIFSLGRLLALLVEGSAQPELEAIAQARGRRTRSDAIPTSAT